MPRKVKCGICQSLMEENFSGLCMPCRANKCTKCGKLVRFIRGKKPPSPHNFKCKECKKIDGEVAQQKKPKCFIEGI